MASIPGKNGGTLTPWPKGTSGNPSGKKRKYVSRLKHIGYKLSEINDTLENVLSMHKEELDEVIKNKKSTALEIIVVRSLKNAMAKGDLDSIETLLTRIYGKPKNTDTSALGTSLTLEEGIERLNALAQQARSAKDPAVD